MRSHFPLFFKLPGIAVAGVAVLSLALMSWPVSAEDPVADGVVETAESAPPSAAAESKQAEPQEVTFGKYNPLNRFERYVILQKGTERPSQGGYTATTKAGTYICRRCNAQLYHSTHKFESHCGWPSFDDEIEGAIERQPDADGVRVEIVCKNCGGHLGHVFTGERLTEKNVRHCVNSISMKLIPKGKEIPPMIKPVEARDAQPTAAK